MSYDIRKTNGTQLVDLDNEVVDTETLSNINLIGYLTPNYGCEQSENFVHLTENFANKEFPENPVHGQICYIYKDDSDTNVGNNGDLYLCVDLSSSDNTVRWKKMPLVKIDDKEPNGEFRTGDMWYNTNKKAFNMYDANISEWVKIGPNDYETTKTEIVSSDDSEYSNKLIIIDWNDREKYSDYDVYSSYMVTINVIGKEYKEDINNPNNKDIPLNNCATGAWKIQLLINCYQPLNKNPNISIVGMPDYELIGATDSSWNVEAVINEDKLIINTYGNPIDGNNKVRWIAKADILKVK